MANKGDVQIDHQDLLLANGAFVDDEDPEQWKDSYQRWLDETYERDRQRRVASEKGRF